jgi:chloramphenicol-sensitive protein RarD
MQGFWLALAAYIIWGTFPLYFYFLKHVIPLEVLSNRIIWSFLVTLVIIALLQRFRAFWSFFFTRRSMPWLIISSLLIAVNWLIYIWAVSQGRVIEASLGYYITPLVSLLLARLFLKERLHPLQALGGLLAALAVAWEVYMPKQAPWIALSLALSFGSYGLVRKRFPVDGLYGLTAETLWLLPFALMWLIWQALYFPTSLHFADDSHTTWLLVGSGMLTAIPLLLFAAAAKRLDLSIVGFIMYINPTMQFLIAVFILKEDYDPKRLLTFALIWLALAIFMAGIWRSHKRQSVTRPTS